LKGSDVKGIVSGLCLLKDFFGGNGGGGEVGKGLLVRLERARNRIHFLFLLDLVLERSFFLISLLFETFFEGV